MTPKVGSPPSAARTGVWVGMGAIAMAFAAYTSAMMVRREGAPDWHHFQLPSILYAVNTVILLASSVALEAGRRRIGDDYEVDARRAPTCPWRWGSGSPSWWDRF